MNKNDALKSLNINIDSSREKIIEAYINHLLTQVSNQKELDLATNSFKSIFKDTELVTLIPPRQNGWNSIGNVDTKTVLKDGDFSQEQSKLVKWVFGLGIASIFLGGWLGIIPLIGLVLGIYAMLTMQWSKSRPTYRIVIGFILSLLFFLLNAHYNGHL